MLDSAELQAAQKEENRVRYEVACRVNLEQGMAGYVIYSELMFCIGTLVFVLVCVFVCVCVSVCVC